jgi:hypothetical protein
MREFKLLINGKLVPGVKRLDVINPVKLPRFRGVFDGFVDYGSVVTTSIMASYAIGER